MINILLILTVSLFFLEANSTQVKNISYPGNWSFHIDFNKLRALLNEANAQVMPFNFLEACRKEDITTIKDCLRRGVDVNAQNDEGYTALMLMLPSKKKTKSSYNAEKRLQIVRLLLKNGADPKICNNNNKSAYDLTFVNHKRLHISQFACRVRAEIEKLYPCLTARPLLKVNH